MPHKNDKPTKIRLDQILVNQGFAASRDEAQRIIRSGNVIVNDERIDKPGQKVKETVSLRVTGNTCPYASRGGFKLEKALKKFSINVIGQTAADFGASNGGFTDCLLKNGAQKVYAVDVGHGQLEYGLQQDSRVVVMDKTNCRYLTADHLGEPVDLVTADLSFISLKTVFAAVDDVVKPNGNAVVLVKPQFEIGKDKVGKGGLVKNPDDHFDVLCDLISFIETQSWKVRDITFSPITGKSGNIEFLFDIVKAPGQEPFSKERVSQTVEEAHRCHTIRI